MQAISAFLVGVLFAIGLGISGMTQPEKIIGFLDLFGEWDASLLFVMLGAVLTYFVFYRLVRGRAPLLAPDFQLPTALRIDRRLLTGAALFGVGWGLAGFCPGPALASIGSGTGGVLLFVAAMLAGMYLYELVERLRRRRLARSEPAWGTSSATTSR
jgi:hypothetical protein